MSQADLPDERFLVDIAQTIRRRGWREPALLALDAARPLALPGSQLLWLAQPVLSLFVSGQSVGRLARLLEAPDGLATLAQLLEES